MLKKTVGLVMAIVLVLGLVACGGNEVSTSNSSSESDQKVAETKKDQSNTSDKSDKVEEGEKVKMVLQLDNAWDNLAHVEKALDEVMAMEKYANIEWEILPQDAGYLDKLPIAISVGEQRDLIYAGNMQVQQKWAQAGLYYPLDDLAATAGVDLVNEFGQYEEKTIHDGQHLVFPWTPSQWGLYYNKNVFDEAGIAYPDLQEPMTWDDYNTLAAELTSGEGADKIYGALEVDWPMFWQGMAILELDGTEGFYNEEGLSNFDDPIFAKALQAKYDRMFVDESVPTYADVVTTKLPVQSFMNGQYGMILQGSWMLSWMSDKDQYPRDWDFGVAPMPVDDISQKKSWGQAGGIAIAKTTGNPQVAFDIAMDLTRLSAEYTTIPNAIQTVEQTHVFEIQADACVDDGITREDMQYIFAANPEIMLVSEKVLGYNASEYVKIMDEEVELFFVNEQDLDTTISNIKTRADEALAK